MKILLIHHAFLEEDDFGGSRFNEMTKIWSNLGHDITVIASMVHYNGNKKRDEYVGKKFVKKHHGKITVWRCHTTESLNKSFTGRLWGYFSFMFSSLWAGLFKVEGKFDVILVTSPPLFVGVSAFLISKIKKIPYVFEVRDLWPESAIDTGVLKNKYLIWLAYWIESLIYRNAKMINVLTPAFQQHLIQKKNVPTSKLLMIPNAADFSISEQVLETFDRSMFREKLGWNDKFVILYVGAHGIANGLHQVIDVCQKITDPSVLFVLIGDGMTKNSLIKEANDKNIKNISFLDPVPKVDVFKYIIAADLGASILAKNDTFKTVYSNKTFDYMSCRRPILMAIDGASRKLIEESGGGTYVEPENTESYLNVISTYMHDRNLILSHGNNGYDFAKKNFDREHLALKYIDEIQKNITNSSIQ
jgi:glycosyltransferase involved in cell wall biosynthesis